MPHTEIITRCGLDECVYSCLLCEMKYCMCDLCEMCLGGYVEGASAGECQT